ncbi:YjjW family glycine radical enzyme activase [Vibrio sp. CAU 1672]|uniref:YjjW family glycine radical enzyme activase n=1 Tax=Vibrio sp. CAU 1672 TaxID=3032594 RepID=UPI0023DA5A50|nr:YjjW family glycine radical enzyme activase [Vibrio sp. CAU 1672]MDF2154638.1 YjjW family glycine radical enzyme activase [Vibrio sp. CAU 1672]
MSGRAENRVARVSRILPFSCVDGPGNRLVIFLQGCNYQCLSCHNPHTINHCNHCGDCVGECPAGALELNESNNVVWLKEVCTHCDHCIDVCQHQSNPKIADYSVNAVLDLIREQRFFISGVTLSGGEATLQLPFVIELFKAIKADPQLCELTCFIDSNGSLSAAGWDKLIPYCDGAMIDLKAWQEETHQWLVGRGNHRVFQSISRLAQEGKLYEVRLLHIPGISDLEAEIAQVGHYLEQLPGEVRIRLNAFQHHGVVGEALTWPRCSLVEIRRFRDQLSRYVTKSITLPSVIR